MEQVKGLNMLEKTSSTLVKCDNIEICISVDTYAPKADDYPHLVSLCQAHANELRVFGILQLNIDSQRYLELQANGKLLFLTGRRTDDKKIMAYSSHIIHRHMHYRQVWVGQEDSIYVMPELRRHGLGRKLRERAIEELRQRGCKLMTARTKFGHEDDTNLGDLGFKQWEVCHAKVL